MEGLLVEALQQELELFLKILAVGIGIDQRRAEGSTSRTVVATADAHDHATVRHDVSAIA